MGAFETEKRISLKLMVLKEQSKVIFAEAGKDFVDVLFSFLTLPLGTIARLVRKESQLQPPEVSLSSIYQSVENLPKECLRTDTCEEMLLRPRNSMEAYCRSLKINIDDKEPKKYFSNPSFMITDDLKVFPYSFDKVINVLKDSGFKSMSSLSKMTVNITKNQVLDLLKCCFCSRTVLTDLFLEKLRRDISHESGRITSCYLKGNNCDEIVVKIVLRKSNGKILFVEGKADFADLIFSLLTIPLGGALQLMGGCSYVGSVDGLYKSVVDLDEHYFTTKEVKNKFVDPLLAPHFKLSNLLPLSCDNFPNYFCFVISHGLGFETCCLTSMYKEDELFSGCVSSVFVDPLSDPSKNGEGYTKGPTTYIATDDLVVTPSSSISVMSLLISMNIPVDDLLEKEVRIGMEEGVHILQASLTSTSALTLGLSHLTKVKEQN
ncbi:hypothetical protein VNO80_07272 [Phaseolus coccineus]|uniref:DUF674 family protein n=1 Tax=Phaseolus coccineus TaxID=3886 RepID=A0AAN9NN53_PHACN